MITYISCLHSLHIVLNQWTAWFNYALPEQTEPLVPYLLWAVAEASYKKLEIPTFLTLGVYRNADQLGRKAWQWRRGGESCYGYKKVVRRYLKV